MHKMNIAIDGFLGRGERGAFPKERFGNLTPSFFVPLSYAPYVYKDGGETSYPKFGVNLA